MSLPLFLFSSSLCENPVVHFPIKLLLINAVCCLSLLLYTIRKIHRLQFEPIRICMDLDFLRPTDTCTWYIHMTILTRTFCFNAFKQLLFINSNLSIRFICVCSLSSNSFYFISWMRVNFLPLFFHLVSTEAIIMQANRQISVFFFLV